MLTRSKTSLAIGMSCAAGAALAGGAMAHSGAHHGVRAGLDVKVRGIVTELTPATPAAPGTITVSPGGTLAPWTCALREGADTSGVVVDTTTVRIRCRSRHGVLGAKRIRVTDADTGKVKARAAGLVTAFTAAGASTKAPGTPTGPSTPTDPKTPTTPADRVLFDTGASPAEPAAPGTITEPAPGSITIDPGSGLPAVTCAITGRTRVRTAPVVGTSTARIVCRTRGDVLVAKTVRVKDKRSGSAKKAGGSMDRTERH